MDLYFWKWTLGEPYYKSARIERRVETQVSTNDSNVTEYDSQQNAINQSLEDIDYDNEHNNEHNISSNKREEIDNRAAGRELVQQRGANPFLTAQSSYVNDIVVRDMFLKPINTSQEKIKNMEENI